MGGRRSSSSGMSHSKNSFSYLINIIISGWQRPKLEITRKILKKLSRTGQVIAGKKSRCGIETEAEAAAVAARATRPLATESGRRDIGRRSTAAEGLPRRVLLTRGAGRARRGETVGETEDDRRTVPDLRASRRLRSRTKSLKRSRKKSQARMESCVKEEGRPKKRTRCCELWLTQKLGREVPVEA